LLLAQIRHEGLRQRRGTVLVALARADGELAWAQVDVEDAEAQAFAEPQAGAEEQ
jgi:hypothetical protein